MALIDSASRGWHAWFAWYPVRVFGFTEAGLWRAARWIWLRKVEWSETQDLDRYAYRFPEIPMSDASDSASQRQRMPRIRPPQVIAGELDELDGRPYVCDCRNWDIPNTIAGMIRNAPPGLVAISLRPYGAGMIAAAERAARRRGVRIIWLPIGKAVRGDDD